MHRATAEAPARVTDDGAAGEEWEHPVCDRDEDRQRQTEAAYFDGEEHEARVVHVQIRGIRGQANETGGKRDDARERVPGSAAVAPDDPPQECHANQPPADRDQHA